MIGTEGGEDERHEARWCEGGGARSWDLAIHSIGHGAVQATIGDGGDLARSCASCRSRARPIVMQQAGRTSDGGYGEPPRRTRGRRGETTPRRRRIQATAS